MGEPFFKIRGVGYDFKPLPGIHYNMRIYDLGL
jgi:hypothetical protein